MLSQRRLHLRLRLHYFQRQTLLRLQHNHGYYRLMQTHHYYLEMDLLKGYCQFPQSQNLLLPHRHQNHPKYQPSLVRQSILLPHPLLS